MTTKRFVIDSKVFRLCFPTFLGCFTISEGHFGFHFVEGLSKNDGFCRKIALLGVHRAAPAPHFPTKFFKSSYQQKYQSMV